MDVKKHKHKKHKKEKRAKIDKKHDSDSDSVSDEMEWVEASSVKLSEKQTKHEEWMDDDSFVPTYSRHDLLRKNKRKQDREEAAARDKMILEQRELNPHWKNKGTGIPAEESHKKDDLKLSSHSVGDGGYSWLKKAYQRVKEQAEEEHRTMEDVAQERWGSLDKLENMLSQAKNRMPNSCRSNEERQYSYKNKREYSREKHDRHEKYDEFYHSGKSSEYSKQDYDRHRYEKEDKYRSKAKYGDDHREEDSQYKFEERSSHKSSKFVAPTDDSFNRNKRPSSSDSFSSYKPSWKKKSTTKDSIQDHDSSSQSSSKSPSISQEESSIRISTGRSEVKEEHVAKGSSGENESDQEDNQGPDPKLLEEIVLGQNEMNYLGARLLRAKLEGDRELASRIQMDFEFAKEKRMEFIQSGGKIEEYKTREDVLDSLVDAYPLPKSLKHRIHKRERRRSRNVHVGPMRKKRYTDDNSSLKDIYENERMSTVDDQMKMYFAAASASQESLNDECDADVSGKMEKKMNTYASQERDILKAIQSHKKLDAAISKCRYCWDHILRHTVVAKGENIFLCVPSYKSLVEGHCFIVPLAHVPSTLHLEENEYKEIRGFKNALMKMSSDQGNCMVFMETSYRHHYHPHAAIECIPMPRETGELAPLYFKKAIDESEYEWAQNKKLIDLSKKNVRHSVPKGLPFFSVEFGLEGGYAHIIEDERQFPHYFGKEIIGGMLEIDSHYIVKQKEESTEEICKKVMKLVKAWWGKYKEYV